MSLHLNLSTGKFLNSSTLFKLSDALVLDVSSGEIVMSNLLVPRAVSVSSSPTLFGDATLDLNFASSLSLDDAVSGNNIVTFSRASSGTYVGSDGLIKTSPVNLIRYSEEFDKSAVWNTTNMTVTPNSTVAPDGTTTADTLTATAGNADIYQSTPTTNVTHINSVWIKRRTGTGQILIRSPQGQTNIDITSQVTNEWKRISSSATLPFSGGTLAFAGVKITVSGDEVDVWGIQSEIGSTATTYIPTTSTIGGAPRFDHDPVTLESLGLLVEESRTNLVTDSASANNWTVLAGGTTAASSSICPDGSTDGTRVTAVVLNDGAYKPFTATTSGNHISTYYARTRTGVAVDVKAANSGSAGPTVTLPADGTWVRVVGAVSNLGAGSKYLSIRSANASMDIDVWGLQAEFASFPTSYIPTTSSAVTRAADLASITGTDFSSWYNDAATTLYIESPDFPNYGNKANSAFVYISDQNVSTISVKDGIKFGTGSPETNNRVFVSEGGGTTQATSLATQSSKFAIAVSENDFNFTVDGTNVGTDNTVVMVTGMDRLAMTGYGPGLAHLSRLSYFPTRKSDEDLVSLTLPTVITYGITSPGGVFNLRSTGTVDYEVDWELTGSREASTENTLPHTYTAGDYTLAVYSDGVYRPYFNNVTADVSQITSVVIGSGADLGNSLNVAWLGASNMTSFVCPFDVTSGVTDFYAAWFNLNILTSFPLINTSLGTDFSAAWYGCGNLTSFPLINTSSGINFGSAWRLCSNLADFPANMFDTTGTLIAAAFNGAWLDCALTAQSIENILVSLDTNGATGITLGINGGTNAAKTTWSAAAVTAYDNLIVKGWTINFNA